MMNPDRRYGPLSGRIWGLMANLACNLLALYGLAGYLRDGTDLVPLGLGLAGSIACIAWLAQPGR